MKAFAQQSALLHIDSNCEGVIVEEQLQWLKIVMDEGNSVKEFTKIQPSNPQCFAKQRYIWKHDSEFEYLILMQEVHFGALFNL